MSIEVEIKGGRELANAMETVRRKTGITVAQSVAIGAQQVANSMRSQARPGKKLHRMIRNTAFFRKSTWRKGGPQQTIYPYHIEKLRQGGKRPILVGSFDLKDPRRAIQRRGLSKAVWNVIAARAGLPSKSAGRSARLASRLGRVSKETQSSDPWVKMEARLGYMEASRPGITNKAIEKGTRAMLGYTFRKLQKDLAG